MQSNIGNTVLCGILYIVNGIKRNPELSSYHTLVTNSVRKRVRDYVHREVGQYKYSNQTLIFAKV